MKKPVVLHLLIIMLVGGIFPPANSQNANYACYLAWEGDTTLLHPGETLETKNCSNSFLLFKNLSPKATLGWLLLRINDQAPDSVMARSLNGKPTCLLLDSTVRKVKLANISDFMESPIQVYLFRSNLAEPPSWNCENNFQNLKPMQIICGKLPDTWSKISFCNLKEKATFLLYINNNPLKYQVNIEKKGKHQATGNCFHIIATFREERITVFNLSLSSSILKMQIL